MLELINTSDGSHTIKHHGLNETYHSTHGAIQESRHVYIEQGLHYYINQRHPKSIRILEIGFGTGLNALLTMIDDGAREIKKAYHTVEAFPLTDDILNQLNYPDQLGKEAQLGFSKLHKAPWNEDIEAGKNFTIHKINADIRSLKLSGEPYDLIYFDAFAPKIQPEIWGKSVLTTVIGVMSKEGILVTYCASGQFKRDLKSLNMQVEEVSGPPGKRVMTRAHRLRK
ncbi:MAG: tRNA (5-methylaminomethyl-2-thiouridine)(34)-methyltransferase MnmD [Cyclobacteriaceae bacterium]